MGVHSLRSSITFSIAVHLLVFLFCALSLTQRAADVPNKKLTYIDIEPPRPMAPRKAEKVEDETSHRQIVQTSKAEEVKVAPEDAYLGERNQKVDRQTVNKNQTTLMGRNATAAHPIPKKSLNHPAQKTGPSEKASDFQQLRALGSLGIPILPVKPKLEPTPSDEDYREWSHESANEQSPQDYIKGLKTSEKTALSTKEFVYYGYYQRIRERLDRAWVPILRERLMTFFRSGRHLASDMDHSTRVLVVLNPEGEIVRVQILSASGIHDLDESAVKAFNHAGPFPNPPKGLANKEGQIQIPWEFILKT